jgi:cobalt/nickel transport system permease protein
LGNRPTSVVSAAVVAAWVSVLAAAALFCVEFACSTTSNQFSLQGIFTLMVLYHALIGVGEALITGSILGFVLSRRPDLISAPTASRPISTVGRFVVAGMVTSLAVAAFLAPFKSDHPDGLDKVSEVTGVATLKSERDGLVLNDYELRLSANLDWPALATSLAGLLGTGVVFAMAIGLGTAVRWNHSPLAPDGGHAS